MVTLGFFIVSYRFALRLVQCVFNVNFDLEFMNSNWLKNFNLDVPYFYIALIFCCFLFCLGGNESTTRFSMNVLYASHIVESFIIVLINHFIIHSLATLNSNKAHQSFATGTVQPTNTILKLSLFKHMVVTHCDAIVTQQ